ncbi:MAG: response regulator [Novosphingobium sp.]
MPDRAVAGAGLGARARVLVVDDDERNLLALSEVLTGVADIVTASSGREALRELLRGDFAVILLDVFMPGLDGYETAQLIRQRKQTSRIPIIFLSAVNKETEHLMRGYAMGAVDYVFKPVDAVVLKSKVGVFVDLHTMRLQVEEQGRAEQALRDANHRAELERLRIEQELQVSMQRQAAILDALPIALYEEDADGAGLPQRRFIGGDVEKLTGLTAAQLAADEALFHALVHPDDRARVAEFLRHCEDDGHVCEYRWVAPDGETRHFLDQRVPLEARGATKSCAGTLIDITEQKRLEAQLLQSGKLDAIGQLTGGIAHDFNNLLASILGGIQLLSRRMTFAEPEARIVELMQHAAQQGAELVRRMMAFARKQDLSPSTFDPVALRDSVAGLVAHALGGSIQFEWTCPDDVGHLYVDRAQMELALVNLVLNARDAMPAGGTIRVDISRLAPHAAPPGLDRAAGEYLRIAVKDSGEGIPPELLEKITEPFFTTKEAGKGTGLGLSMVFGFVRQSGGQLVARSEPGQGTTIELILPRGGETAGVAAASTRASHRPPLSIRSVLLVDDDDAVRTILREQLSDKGVTVFAVEDGASALARLEAEPGAYDLLLTDFAMPGLNGIETIERALRISPAIRPLLMTGFADERTLATLDPSIPLLRKPISFETLEAALA